MVPAIMRPAEKSVWPAVALFLVAPLIAEFLLGNLPIKMLPVILVLAPLYGGGALLIRELVRRAGRGWPSIVVLALAYGIVEEAYTTQSLFNPNYLKLNLHLLQPAYLPALGIGAWWTIFVLTLHTAWSISIRLRWSKRRFRTEQRFHGLATTVLLSRWCSSSWEWRSRRSGRYARIRLSPRLCS